MKKTIWLLSLLFAMAFVFFGCSADEQDVSIDGVVATTNGDETYEYICSVSDGSYHGTAYDGLYPGILHKTEYLGDSFYTKDTAYKSYSRGSFKLDSGTSPSGYYKSYYSKSKTTQYTVTSGKVKKETFKNKNFKKYTITFYGYVSGIGTMDDSGTISDERPSDKTRSEIKSITLYEVGGKFYKDDMLSEIVSFKSGTPNDGEFVIDKTEDTRKTTRSYSSSTSSSSSNYYDYYERTSGTYLKATVKFTRK